MLSRVVFASYKADSFRLRDSRTLEDVEGTGYITSSNCLLLVDNFHFFWVCLLWNTGCFILIITRPATNLVHLLRKAQPLRGELRVPDGVLDRTVSEVGLDGPSVHAVVGQLVAAGDWENMRVDRQTQLCLAAGPTAPHP